MKLVFTLVLCPIVTGVIVGIVNSLFDYWLTNRKDD